MPLIRTWEFFRKWLWKAFHDLFSGHLDLFCHFTFRSILHTFPDTFIGGYGAHPNLIDEFSTWILIDSFYNLIPINSHLFSHFLTSIHRPYEFFDYWTKGGGVPNTDLWICSLIFIRSHLNSSPTYIFASTISRRGCALNPGIGIFHENVVRYILHIICLLPILIILRGRSPYFIHHMHPPITEWRGTIYLYRCIFQMNVDWQIL